MKLELKTVCEDYPSLIGDEKFYTLDKKPYNKHIIIRIITQWPCANIYATNGLFS